MRKKPFLSGKGFITFTSTGGVSFLETHVKEQRVTLQPWKANVYGTVFSILFFVISIFLYGGEIHFSITLPDLLFFIVLIVVGIVIHEILHGLGFYLSGKVAWSDIRFGVVWTKMIFYACCLRPLPISNYRLAVLLPGLLLGIIPYCVALYAQSLFWYSWSIIMILGAFGDGYILWTLRKFGKETRIADDTDAIGYIAYVTEPSQPKA
ncbi:MAG TPA: DUF3267 domain-containing protein [Brevibacillus sp.]|nr:DUF3267 domain-containing protein [Brevibacillus sp.]